MLSSFEKSQLRLYLGYPSLFRYKDTRLESTFDSVDSDAEQLLRDLLLRFSDIDDAIDLSATDGQGTLKAVDEIQFYQNFKNGVAAGLTETQTARAKQLVTRMSVILGVPLYGDIFSPDGYPGDTFSELGGLGRSSNILPLG